MTKHGGRYYLQYSAPGTEYKTYADGVFVADRPEGPYTYAPWSPASAKPSGFIAGAGHGATFQDKDGRTWRIVTMTISVLHMFERRLGLFPAGFDADGVMYTDTALGDFPRLLPDGRPAGWMLLSRGKPAVASSSTDGHAPALAFDEEVRTFWSARTGDAGEWLRVDLGGPRELQAVQLNFAEDGATSLGRPAALRHRYRLEASANGRSWTTLADRSGSTRDAPHDYVELAPGPATAKVRYLRVTNVEQPPGARFGFRDLRVFGRAPGPPPAAVAAPRAVRSAEDPCRAKVTWAPAKGAIGYVVRFGIAPDKLYQSRQAWDAAAAINSLDAGTAYYLAVDSLNESGVTRGTAVVKIP
jgi:hypothetical protein